MRLMLALLCLSLAACSAGAPDTLGATGGRLAPCPNKPNCVSSQSGDEKHFVAPLQLQGPAEAAQAALVRTISGMEGARIVTETPDYLHVEFTTPLMKFVDDVELVFDSVSGVAHVRSASRLGYSDLGANRKRVEDLRAHLGTAQAESAQP